MGVLRMEINGEPATPEQVRSAQTYGHFTSMQVRDGAVAGWRHHLRRLADSSQELFGRPLEPGRVAELVRSALRDMPAAVSVRVNVFARSGVPVQPVDPDLLVIVAGPETSEPGPPMRVRSIGYERDLAHLKHYDFLGVLHRRRQAQAAGFDDVLFVDRRGRISEGSIWNIAFWDGERVVWPEADMLCGITMQVLAEGLDRIGVPQVQRPVLLDELPALRAAFATNSVCPAQPIGSIDDVAFSGTGDADPLSSAWAAVPAEPLG
ncbi:MAG: aminotransferase class IV [Saccharopolyspora sp.]|uniref:aminotransferase class IV n=1 Tax=Saccharopolyspora sp. TaxID=33915 RepID=UPI0025DA5184|nr:aminotransferase class IV [Saccharopolyspora sp.]MBQ6640428.1 aminotransferase class IV [Saccharopolyspora sp.]